MPENYLEYYDLEGYLFDTVSPRFREQGYLKAFDFFCIIIWKANRAKSKVARHLKKRSGTSLESAVKALTSDLAAASTDREKFEVVLGKWGLRLPMGTAILSVLYTDRFTVYDARVCDELDGFRSLAGRVKLESLWRGYEEFQTAVRDAAPTDLSLRDKDRWLWARSFAEQLRNDISRDFGIHDDPD